VKDQLSGDPYPAHYYSTAFCCTTCGWWCIRERYALQEIMQDGDLLLVGIRKIWDASQPKDDQPWLKALENHYAYTHDLEIPLNILTMLDPDGIYRSSETFTDQQM
jgi:hypothetical protein